MHVGESTDFEVGQGMKVIGHIHVSLSLSLLHNAQTDCWIPESLWTFGRKEQSHLLCRESKHGYYVFQSVA